VGLKLLNVNGPPPTNGGGPNDVPLLTSILDVLELIQYDLDLVSEPGLKKGTTDYFTITAGGTSQPLYSNTKKVSNALIQNLSTDPLTLRAASAVSAAVADQGIVLNPSTGAGLAGGSLPVGNVDLSTYTIIGATTGDGFSIYWEAP